MQRKSTFSAKYLVAGIALCLALLFAGALSQAKDKSFYFVQITDTHLGYSDHEERLTQVVQAINKLPFQIEFVVHTGDITTDKIEDGPTLAGALSILKLLKPPIHYVAGNHDILRKKLDSTTMAFKNNFGDLISQKEYGGVVFLFVYTEPFGSGFSLPSYDPLAELGKRLKQSAGKPVVVFHHSPSVGDFYSNEMHPGWEREKEWVTLLNRYNVKGVIAGHFHRDELHWLGKVPLYVCPPVAGHWGRQASFRIYEYKDGKIGYRTQYIPS